MKQDPEWPRRSTPTARPSHSGRTLPHPGRRYASTPLLLGTEPIEVFRVQITPAEFGGAVTGAQLYQISAKAKTVCLPRGLLMSEEDG